ncbi:MAG: GNAT family N-acetyltransferase [Paracoccaceae bacterium]
MFVRPVSRRDRAKIPDLIEAAFGRHDEALLVQELFENGDIVMEFVATDRDELIGHVALSKLVRPAGCLALAPVSVHPDRQEKGIGSTLIRAASEAAEEQGWTAAFVLGNPRYYGRFGFEVEAADDFDTPFSHEFTAARVFDPVAFQSLPRELVYPGAF